MAKKKTSKKKATVKKAAKKKVTRKKAAKKTAKKKTTRTRAKGKATASAMLQQPVSLTYDQIATRAFQVWERKGKPAGQDMANWREAEAELLAEAEA